MKQAGVIFPILLVLLTAVFAQEALAASPGSAEAEGPTTPRRAFSEDFFCSLSQVATAALPGEVMDPKQATEDLCGACGTKCAGKVMGSRCHNFPAPGWGWCYPGLGGTTCTDGRPMCLCYGENAVP